MSSRTLSREFIKSFSPLSGLKPENQSELAAKTAIQMLDAGRYLFKQGDTDRRNFYLVRGSVELRSGDKVLMPISGGSDEARHPLAPQVPRHLSARASTDIEYFTIDRDLLDILLTWDQTGSFQVGEIQARENEAHGDDWMTAILQTKAFHRIPPANIQTLFMRMERLARRQGDVIIRQGDQGDFFYIVAAGRCLVTREVPSNKGIKLAELGVGASFGEEALLSDAPRNATVTMLTPGALIRLAKADFNTLLKEPLQQWVSLEQAKQITAAGGQWLDVRLPSEFERLHPDGAVNIPLYSLRMKFETLDPKRRYVVCCDTGRRSSAGAYILSERGFDVCVLKDGLAAQTSI